MEELNRVPGGLKPDQLAAVLVTHAHLDHTGRLPLLTRAGYRGPIYATPATIELTGLILRDSVKVQAHDLGRGNRKPQRAGKPPVDTHYRPADVERTLSSLHPVPYDEPVGVAPGVHARFVEAGHMLGSASVQLSFQNGSPPRCVVFSGDVGPRNPPLLKDAVGSTWPSKRT